MQRWFEEQSCMTNLLSSNKLSGLSKHRSQSSEAKRSVKAHHKIQKLYLDPIGLVMN